MSISYNWTVSETNYEVSNGFVFCAHWQANATDGDYSASVYSTCSWSEGTATIAYADLTKETVLGWIWANGVDKDAVEDSLLAQIAEQKAPVKATGVPWNV
jgi:hypothetical protein